MQTDSQPPPLIAWDADGRSYSVGSACRACAARSASIHIFAN